MQDRDVPTRPPDVQEEYATLVGGVRTLLERLRDSGALELPGVLGDPPHHAPPPPPQAPPIAMNAPTPRDRPPSDASGPRPNVRGGAAAYSPPPASSPESRPRAPAVVSPPPPRGADGDVDPIARLVRLETIAHEVAGCVRCPLHATRTQTVFARGNPSTDLMFIGEGPGADEDAQGLPFVGKAGQLLDKMIAAMGYAPDEVYIANIVKCRPPENRTPLPEEMAACEGYLHQQIALVQPKVIVALGATAVEGLLRVKGITKLRGTWRLYRGEIPVMPTFHPAYLLRVPTAKRMVWEDLKLVMGKLGRSTPRK